jgi:filamentous hemagglutinin
LDPSASLGGAGSTVNLDSGQISIQLPGAGALRDQANGAPTTGLVLSGGALQTLENSARALSLLSYTSIDIYGSGTIGSASFSSIALHAPEIYGDGGNAAFAAANILLDNSPNQPAPDASALASGASLRGALTFNAATLQLGANALAIDQYGTVNLNATTGLVLQASGGLATEGNLAINAPVVTVPSGSGNGVTFAASTTISQTIAAGGGLTVTAPSGATASPASGQLGASLNLSGQSVSVDSQISLPSGSIALHATGAAGNVTVGSSGTLNVGGASGVFGSATQYTSGGQISLTSDEGGVAIATGAQLNLAAQAGGGNGGNLSVTAPDGALTMAPGTASGQGGLGGSGGSFSLDVSALPGALAGTSSLGALGQTLDAGGFTESVSVRVRNGPVAVDGTIQAHDVAISADSGSIEVTGSGLIDASGATGGAIDLSAGGSITLDSGSVLSVKGQNFDSAGQGGSVSLEAGAENPANPIYHALGAGPQLNILSGSTIDLSVANNLPLLLDFGGSSITVAAQTPVAFPTGTPGNDEVTFGSNGTLTAANGTTTAFPAGTTTAIAPGSTVELASQGAVAFASGGTGGSIPLSVRAGASIAQTNVTNLTPYDFTGTLALITPQAMDTATGTMPVGVQIGAIDGTLVAPSSIVVEGNFVFTPVAGVIDTMESAVAANGQAFASVANTSAIVAALTANWGGGANQVNAGLSTAPDVLIHVQPAAEIVNTTIPSALLLTNGANTTSLAAGASQTLNAGTTVTAANGSNLVSGTGLTLNVSGGNSGALEISGGGSVVFPIGIPDGDGVQFTSSAPITGTITVGGTSTPFTVVNGAPYATTLAAGSVVTFSGTGTIAFSAGSTAIPLCLANGVYVTAGVGTTTLTNTSGALTLANTWDFSGLRFGPNAVSTNPIGAGEPGNLLLRAAGNVDFLYNYDATTKTAISIASLTDGFDPTSSLLDSVAAGSTTSPNASAEWTAPLLAAGSSSWSFEIVAGADLSAADEGEVEPFSGPGSLPSGTGSVLVGPGTPALPTSTGTAVKSETIIPKYYQTIRTGTGDISIFSSQNILLLNSLATIYTAGTQAPAMAGFETPLAAGLGGVASGAPATQPPYYPPQYSFDGGDVTLAAQNDIAHEIQTASGLAADSSEEMPTNWLYRRGSLGAGGVFGTVSLSGEPPTVESTSWWIDFSNFFEGVGALGGGDVSLSAGHDISDVDGLVPTEARMTGTDASGNALAPGAATLLELGGGDLTVRAGDDINGGVYYVERGQGVLSAGNQILTNSTRTALDPGDLQIEDSVAGAPDPTTELPTTLFLGQGSFTVAAGGNVDLGAVANPFLLPQGTNNAYYNKSYFSTYALADTVTVTSLAGSVTLDDDPVNADGSLLGWYTNVLYQNPAPPTRSVAQSQPWLGLVESLPSDFSSNFALMPSTLYATAFSGSINVVGQLTLAPAPTGTIDLLAAGSINGTQVNSLVEASAAFNASTNPYVWDSSVIDLSDANLALVPGPGAPLGLSSLGKGAQSTQGSVLSGIEEILDASGATLGSNVVLQTKEALHGSLPDSTSASAEPLHYDDLDPIVLSASQGDISGLTLYSGKAAQVVAGTDITDIGLYIQNVIASNVTVVSAGRDVIAYDPNSPLRLEAQAPGNELDYSVGDPLVPASSSPTSGDIQIGGPGTLEVLAGRNLDLGTGSPTSTDGLAVGITSIGNTLNPLLPFAGANIVTGAGISGAAELSNSRLDFTAFISQFLNPTTAAAEAEVTLPELGQLMGLADDADSQVWAAFENLSAQQQDLLALHSFYLVLRDAGRNRNNPESPDYGNYNSGYAAIAALFPGKNWAGDVTLSTREIETMNGGDIGLFAPGGGVTVGLSTDLQTPDQGILTERGGDISLFAQDSVSLGTSRIFTLQGGNEIIWSTVGNIAAGSGSKTVFSAPPTRVLIDPQSADVENDPAGLATGSGIGVLATLANAPLGSVDLIAPSGTVDAGDAGNTRVRLDQHRGGACIERKQHSGRRDRHRHSGDGGAEHRRAGCRLRFGRGGRECDRRRGQSTERSADPAGADPLDHFG